MKTTLYKEASLIKNSKLVGGNLKNGHFLLNVIGYIYI